LGKRVKKRNAQKGKRGCAGKQGNIEHKRRGSRGVGIGQNLEGSRAGRRKGEKEDRWCKKQGNKSGRRRTPIGGAGVGVLGDITRSSGNGFWGKQ